MLRSHSAGRSFLFDRALLGVALLGFAGSSAVAGSFHGLGDLDGGTFSSSGNAVSGDGSTAVGASNSTSGLEAFRWTSGGGMVGLGDLPGGIFRSIANDVSGDGSIVVGGGTSTSTFNFEAFIWDAVNGMRDLKQVLVTEYGLDLTGWTLREARGISADGRTIVGFGINPAGQTEAWIAVVPEPMALSLLLPLAGLFLRRRQTRRA